ncbi:methyltransferase domain-containing protein [Stappia sp. GBMRC 2046]|uniref:Methyltransferase domain-containing protein n=1 Tax=Stappia sediminis TaxID=2692190 RepID=A0A7X3LU80_9HYPH|nr:methyltransferase domain-containing protein [Stappia sediminis]MXN65184.1 methyltransferase domain-containing protein [Stappia sediminis]
MSQPMPIDRGLLARRRRRALEKGTKGADFLLAAVCEDLGERLSTVKREFELAVDLGGHGGRVAEMLRASENTVAVLRADLFCPDPRLAPPDLVVDDEFPPFADQSVDLIVSALSLQWVNDLPGALIQIRRALRPDGLFLGCLPGGDTLFELRDSLLRAEVEVTGGASPRVIPFAGTRDLGALLQRAGFALPVADQDTITVRYDTMFDLMRDLRDMGATNVLTERSRRPASRKLLYRAAEIYAHEHADDDGRVRATFQFVSLSGWAPHESQQKPLKPGSAKMRLADALGTQELDPHGGK